MSEKPGPSTPLPSVGQATTAEAAARRGIRLGDGSLRAHTSKGALINGLFMVGLSALGLVKGFVLAAFLSREDYGVWGILIVTLGTLLLLKQVGIGDKYIQQDEEDQELAFQKAFTLELALTGVVMALVVVVVPLMAFAYGEEQIIGPGLVVLAVLPAGVLQMPIWTYYRRMEFLTQRALLAVDPVIGFITSVALAIAGAGYWALVLGLVAGAWSGAIAGILCSPYRLRLRFDRGTFRSYASFSWPLFATALAALVIAQGSIVTSQAYLGLAGVGVVTLAQTITQFTDRVDGMITGALYPAVVAVRDRRDLLYESFVKSNRLALMWAMPFGVALTLFCQDIVSFGLGEEWQPAVVVLQVFGVAAAIGHVGFNWNAYFQAVANTRPIAVASAAAALVFVASVVPLVSAYGLRGFAVAIALQAVAAIACRAYYLGRLFEGFDYVRHALRAMAPTLPAGAAVLLVRVLESGERSLAMALAELVLYALVTIALTLALERSLLREVLGYLRTRPAAGAPGLEP